MLVNYQGINYLVPQETRILEVLENGYINFFNTQGEFLGGKPSRILGDGGKVTPKRMRVRVTTTLEELNEYL